MKHLPLLLRLQLTPLRRGRGGHPKKSLSQPQSLNPSPSPSLRRSQTGRRGRPSPSMATTGPCCSCPAFCSCSCCRPCPPPSTCSSCSPRFSSPSPLCPACSSPCSRPFPRPSTHLCSSTSTDCLCPRAAEGCPRIHRSCPSCSPLQPIPCTGRIWPVQLWIREHQLGQD